MLGCQQMHSIAILDFTERHTAAFGGAHMRKRLMAKNAMRALRPMTSGRDQA